MVKGQISQGGTPVYVQKLKSVSPDDLIILPTVDNFKLRRANMADPGQPILKSLRFAHPFDVSLNLKNSGKWYSNGDVNVWQLRIRSVGAYSLCLVFGRYNLPENARLFLIGSNGSDIKGAYTSANNSVSQVLAIEPLAGDEMIIQYEEPIGTTFSGELEISTISHDFMGIMATGPHRPLGLSGACNVNVNCDVANGTEEIRDAVCRIIIVETGQICTGTLINNTSLDRKPYLITAEHCINSEQRANSSVFLFNYESPYCSSIYGDVSHSLSGSSLKASLYDLDFALVQLNNEVPYNYRPYFVGWNRKNVAPSSSLSIHHPQGDIKKISFDRDIAITSRYPDRLANGSWQILRWDNGVTESGSSGGPLFDQNKQLIGTLTGGNATCSDPEEDYFSKFALAWNYMGDPSKQLKTWLDPLNSNVEKLAGFSPNTGTTLCKPFTNFKDNDSYEAIPILNGLTKKGYYSGSNLVGFTDFAEQFKFSKNAEVQGVSIGIAKVKTNPLFAQSYINIQIYEGVTQPTTLLYSEKFDIKKFWVDAMNYLQFKNPVKTTGNFFISYNIQELHTGDTLAVYMANRKADTTNSFFLKNQTGWLAYNSQNLNGYGSAMLTELIACNVDSSTKIDSFENELITAKFFPNPLTGNTNLTVRIADQIECPENTLVYDMLGKEQNISCIANGPNELLLNFSGKRPGIYFVRVEAGGHLIVGKIGYMP